MLDRMKVLGLATLIVAGPAAAQDVEVRGQLRPRFEIRDPVGTLGTVDFTSMRTRASLEVDVEPSITAFIQLQDVRFFGEESSTLADYSADGLDLHQGWVELGDAAADTWAVRVGRQEASYGGQRLVGAVNWTQQGRSFDGLRARYRPSDDVVVDGLAFRIADSFITGEALDESLFGLYSTLERGGSVDLFGLLHSRATAFTDLSRLTVGGRWVSETEAVSWRIEGAYQAGRLEGPLTTEDISAFMVGARAGTRFTDALGVTLWYDHLSGDDDPGDDELRVFDTLFATNHKFYGYMDHFLNIPVDTDGRGLQDLAIKASYDLAEDHTLGADLHTFYLAATDGIDSGHIGEELDVTYQWAYTPAVTITSGFSFFLEADAWSAVLGNPDDNQVWAYVMLDLVF